MPTVETRPPGCGPTPDRSIWLVLDLTASKRGSLEEQLLVLAARLRQSGFRPTYVFASEPPDWFREEFARAGADLRVLDFRRPALALATFVRWMGAERPRLVHFHFVRAHSPLIAAARLAGATVLVHDHLALGVSFRDLAPRRALVESIVQRAKRLRARVVNELIATRIAVSDFVATSLMQAEFVPPHAIVVIEHGVDVPKLSAIEGRTVRQELGVGARPVIACASRMAPEKGVDILIRAFARTPGDALLVLAGDGPDVPSCDRLARELGVADRVRFLGLRNDVAAVFASCDIAVVPSRAPEAFGLAVIEAMAVGKPVIVSDSGAMPELVEHGGCGIVVPAADVDALASALGRLLRDRAGAEALGRAAQRRAQARYSTTVWLKRTLELYRRFLTIDSGDDGTQARVVAQS
jgi:glycosyltransferase involved in cell wall biosynthesis